MILKNSSFKLGFFDRWVDPIAEVIIQANPVIRAVRLSFGDSDAKSFEEMRSTNGYQVAPRGELRKPWFVDGDLLRACPNLLAVSSTGAGYDMIDVEACTDAGVIVCNQAGSNNVAVAEHAIGLILAQMRKFKSCDIALRSNGVTDRFFLGGSDIFGKTVGLIGIGQIGARMAQVCAALGMKVVAYDPYVDHKEIERRGAIPLTFDNLLAQSDIVSLHCPRDKETLGLFDKSVFSRMKKGAVFINTARGGIHNENDLYDAITSGHLNGAGLDVFVEEPPPKEHPLLSLPNVVSTPHTAGLSLEALQGMAVYAARQWVEIAKGEVPNRLVNPAAWSKYSSRFSDLFGISPPSLANCK